MYNTRSNNNQGNQYHRKSDNFHPQQQQQQQTMPHVATFVSQKTSGQTQLQQPIHQQPISNMALRNLPSKPLSAQPHTQTTHLPDVNPSIAQDKNNMINAEDGQITEESKKEKSDFKWPPKRKTSKKEQKKRLNARMRRLVCPKSPLMVFSELYKDVPIKLEERPQNNLLIYIASIEVDGQVYTGNHVSKTQAKQKACENFLRVMLAKKINERSEKKEESFADTDLESGGSSTCVKPKGPPQEDFPWQHFASLAMHNLIAHWELQPISKVLQEETNVKLTPKVGGMKKFPENPENYNPVQLLHQMTPGIKFAEKTVSANNPSIFQVRCEVNGLEFVGEGSTKKAAKKECAISAIKTIWNFDFHAIVKNA